MINALVALKLTVAQKAKALAASASDKLALGQQPTQTEERARKLLRVMKDGFHRKATIAGDEWVLFDIITTIEVLEKIDELVPSSVVAGCWNVDGTQYGQVITYDYTDMANPVEVVDGEPVYPIHPKLLDFMPDDVEYNANGTEKSRKRPTTPKQVHKWLGWADRRWT